MRRRSPDRAASGVRRSLFLCDRERLDLAGRLDLFERVCEAVSHAHQRRILHRDLGPAKILVARLDGRPIPKVIGFGISGAPETMQPEQEAGGRGEDAGTDVFALGVILYELMCGAPPFPPADRGRPVPEAAPRPIPDVEPVPPGVRLRARDEAARAAAARRRSDPEALARALAGDLDRIVLRALDRDHDRRHASVNDLAEDLRRHRRREQVTAGPAGRAYRLREFVLSHRAAVAVSAALLALLLISGGLWIW